MNTKRQHKTYTTEFRSEALALISEQGYSVQGASSVLGITTSLLYSWRQKAEELSTSTVNSDERAELLSLRKEDKKIGRKRPIFKIVLIDLGVDNWTPPTPYPVCRVILLLPHKNIKRVRYMNNARGC